MRFFLPLPPPPPKRTAAPWDEGRGGCMEGTDNISDHDIALFPPQCHFFRNTSKEYIIVLKNELDGKQKTTMEPRFNEEPWE